MFQFARLLPKTKKVLALLIWSITLLGFATSNLSNPNLWFDEALQLWASRGQHHYSNYDTPEPDSLKDVIAANYSNTWDPPAFTLALHFLGKITGQLWIFRTLTLLLFYLSLLLFTRLAQHWAPQYLISSIAGLILFLSPLLCHYAFEIRPYMLELLHSALAVYIVCRCDSTWSKKKTFFFAWALAFSMASRYPSIFPALLCVGFMGCKFFYQPEHPKFFVLHKDKLIQFLLLFVPSLLVGITIMILMAANQWQVATAGNAYHQIFLIHANPTEFFNWMTAILWLPLITLLALRLLPLKIFPEITRKYDLYIGFTLALNLLRLIIDFGRFIPYSLIFRFNLPCHTLLLFSYIPLLLTLLEYNALQLNSRIYLNHLVFVLYLLLIPGILFQALCFTREDPDPSIRYLKKLPIDPPIKILTAINAYPALRYACEYGALNDRKHWREQIYFYGDKYPDRKDWIVREKFAFIISRSVEIDPIYYQQAKRKQFNLILESKNFLQGGKGKRPGLSTTIIKLD
ncbi:MAG: hypothetical protein WCT05_05205 [Lentisphaeria bacterium]